MSYIIHYYCKIFPNIFSERMRASVASIVYSQAGRHDNTTVDGNVTG